MVPHQSPRHRFPVGFRMRIPALFPLHFRMDPEPSFGQKVHNQYDFQNSCPFVDLHAMTIAIPVGTSRIQWPRFEARHGNGCYHREIRGCFPPFVDSPEQCLIAGLTVGFSCLLPIQKCLLMPISILREKNNSSVPLGVHGRRFLFIRQDPFFCF